MSEVDPQPRAAWRGWINIVTDGVYFSRRISDERIAARVDDMIQQWTFADPVHTYYEAISDALNSTERIAEPREDEEHARDFLLRLMETLDARRPWPEAAYTHLDASAWSEYRQLPPLAVIALTERTVRGRVNRFFDEVPDGGAVMILRLRTGDTVALHSADFRTPAVTIRAHTNDSAATIDACKAFIGLSADEIHPA